MHGVVKAQSLDYTEANCGLTLCFILTQSQAVRGSPQRTPDLNPVTDRLSYVTYYLKLTLHSN